MISVASASTTFRRAVAANPASAIRWEVWLAVSAICCPANAAASLASLVVAAISARRDTSASVQTDANSAIAIPSGWFNK